jgi:hypothetical protein
MRLLRKVLSLKADERRLLVRATLIMLVIQSTLGRLPFAIVRRLVVCGRGRERGSVVADAHVVNQVVWAVTAVSARLPRRSTCLGQALAVQALLSRTGQSSRLHIGVGRGNDGTLDGHAWIECGGRIVIGGSSATESFTPIATLDDKSVTGLRAVERLRMVG